MRHTIPKLYVYDCIVLFHDLSPFRNGSHLKINVIIDIVKIFLYVVQRKPQLKIQLRAALYNLTLLYVEFI